MRLSLALLAVWTAAVCLGLVPGHARADWPEIELSGHAAGATTVNPIADEHDWLGLARVRGELKSYFGSQATFEAHYQLTFFYGDGMGREFQGAGPPSRLRLTDLEAGLSSDRDWALRQNLDRLWLYLDLPGLGLALGRQVIGHGSGLIFNPTDIFSPLSPFTTYTEYKPGVDALRLTKPLGEKAEVEFIGVAHEDGLDQGLYLGRGRVSLGQLDVSVYGGWSLDQPTLALNLSGQLGGAGWYGEAIGRLDDDRRLRVRATAGFSYRFTFGLEAGLEAHYNGPGADRPTDYAQVTASDEWQSGELFLLGRWYAGLRLGYEFHPLVRGDCLWVQNLSDGSGLISASLTWDATQNLVLKLGAVFGFGRSAERLWEGDDSGWLTVDPGSEFGAYADAVYAEARFYF
ncbi:MAG: hypothetical protein JRJ59_08840 [Deltaproteobacteria bacterium]|nr:hypothetical protein [Deltaproteobacteria bacterium]